MYKSDNTVVVAAFDFGTTYSGYAYSFKHDPTKVFTNSNWYADGSSANLISLKTSTSVLLDDNGQFHSFGYEAEDMFASLATENKHQGWRLFRRFKMALHSEKNLTRKTTVEDIKGQSFPAMSIFTMAIRYLHEHLLKAFKLSAPELRETDIQYVITVPAIWDIDAKQFMREAAIEAGIDGKRLQMALESEVAALWCMRRNDNDGPTFQQPSIGSKCMVIDLGGGTADISVFKQEDANKFDTIHTASGGAWGGIYVDQNYLLYLEKVYGKDVLERFRSTNIYDYFEMIRDFETKKRSTKITSSQSCLIRLPLSLLQIGCESKGERVTSDKMRIDAAEVKEWFEEPIACLIAHIKELLCLRSIRGVQTILLVGGFAESGYVQDRLREELPETNLIVPQEAGLAVLKGALLFGHDPFMVSSRVMTHTYGISTFKLFDEKIHPLRKMVVVKGNQVVEHIFQAFVKANSRIPVDHKVSYFGRPTSISSCIRIYRTLSENPEYTTDEGCELICKLTVMNFQDVPLQHQTFEVVFMFGLTEIYVKVKHTVDGNETEEETLAIIDCLE